MMQSIMSHSFVKCLGPAARCSMSLLANVSGSQGQTAGRKPIEALSPTIRSLLLLSCCTLIVVHPFDCVVAARSHSGSQGNVAIEWKQNRESGVPFELGLSFFLPDCPPLRHMFIFVEPEHFTATDLKKVFLHLSGKNMQPEYLVITATGDKSTLNEFIQSYLKFYSIPRDHFSEKRTGSEVLDRELSDGARKALYFGEYSRSETREGFHYSQSPASQKYVEVPIRWNPPLMSTDDPLSDLVRAARDGFDEKVISLLQKGIDINVRNVRGNTPLVVAADAGQRKIVDILLGGGADVNLPDSTGWSPLMCAIITGRDEIALALLQKGASVNARSASGDTVLTLAAIRSSLKIIDELIRRGADPEQTDRYGRTPLMIAEEHRRADVVSLFRKTGVRK
jgi:ankyrin repeat protein